MGTPLYTTDIIPMTSRPTLTVMDDGDYFVILDTSTGKISKILKTNIMNALKISYDNTTSGLTSETVQAALDELIVNLGSTNTVIESLKGVGWTDENLVDHEDRLDTLEGTGEGSVAKAIEDGIAEVTDQAVKTTSTPTFVGVKFPATQVLSSDPNTLDDYEEGTWTPTLGGDTEEGQVYVVRQGTYIRIGQAVLLYIKIKLSNRGTITGTYMKLKGFPFAMSAIGGGSGYTLGCGGNLGWEIRNQAYAVASKNGESDARIDDITNYSEMVLALVGRAV